MAKTWEQICRERGHVPPEQTIRETEELKAEIGEKAFLREYVRVGMKRSEKWIGKQNWPIPYQEKE